jgi:hypothetical protein
MKNKEGVSTNINQLTPQPASGGFKPPGIGHINNAVPATSSNVPAWMKNKQQQLTPIST